MPQKKPDSMGARQNLLDCRRKYMIPWETCSHIGHPTPEKRRRRALRVQPRLDRKRPDRVKGAPFDRLAEHDVAWLSGLMVESLPSAVSRQPKEKSRRYRRGPYCAGF
jgi:hypothetical protein